MTHEMASDGAATTAVARVNAAIRACDVHKCGDSDRHCMVAAIKAMHRTTSSGLLRVKLGECSEADWRTYLSADDDDASDRELDPQCLSWEEGNLYMIECGATVSTTGKFVAILEDAMKRATGTSFRDLQSHDGAFVDTSDCPKLVPSFSFGPAKKMRALGAQLPSGLEKWEDFHTIKGEVGVHRDWEELDQCAKAWQEYPGVKYVLCIRLSPRGNKHKSEYKFHAINRNASTGVAVVPRMPPVDPMPIDGPVTYVTFDPHHTLGLLATVKLPEGFASQIAIDLYAVLQALAQQEPMIHP